ncbi:MAG: hypothetical protein ACK47M_03410 [Caldilinea sp.]
MSLRTLELSLLLNSSDYDLFDIFSPLTLRHALAMTAPLRQ